MIRRLCTTKQWKEKQKACSSIKLFLQAACKNNTNTTTVALDWTVPFKNAQFDLSEDAASELVYR